MQLDAIEAEFPAGTPVCVRQSVRRRDRDSVCEVVGVVDSWERLPTGSWFARGKYHKLWLARLKLRKADGEISLLVIDDATEIARLEPAKS